VLELLGDFIPRPLPGLRN